MGNIRKIMAVMKYQIGNHSADVKTFVILIMLFFYIRAYTAPIADFAKAVKVGIAPYLFPLFMNDWIFPIVVSLGFLVLVCDAPFIKKGYLFLVARSGKICWVFGQSLFLLLYAMVYAFIVCCFTIVNIIPHLELSMGWGKAIMTLVRTDASSQFHVNPLSAAVAENYSPIEALLKTFLLSVLLFWLIGMIIFVLNYMFKNHVGVMAATIIIFFDLAIYNFFDPVYYKYSPVSLMKLSVVTGVNSWNPTFIYAVCAMVISSIIFIILILTHMKIKKGIHLNDRREN